MGAGGARPPNNFGGGKQTLCVFFLCCCLLNRHLSRANMGKGSLLKTPLGRRDVNPKSQRNTVLIT